MTTAQNFWSSNLFDFCNTQTLYSCCCLPCTTMMAIHNQHNDKRITLTSCCIISLPFTFYNFYPQISFLSYSIILTTLISSLRNNVRGKNNIVSDQTCSDPFYDVFVTSICPHLSLAQTMRQQIFEEEQTYKIIDQGSPEKQKIERN